MPQTEGMVCRSRRVGVSDVALEAARHFDDFGDVLFCYDDIVCS
jgi:hypothetical protein